MFSAFIERLRPKKAVLSRKRRKSLRYFLNTAMPIILRNIVYASVIPTLAYFAKQAEPHPNWLTIFNPLM